MTFDEQLRRAFDTLADRLRDEVNREIQAAIEKVSASARAHADAAVAAAVAASAAPTEPVRQATANAPEMAPTQRLLEAIRAMDDAHSLSEILDALLDGVEDAAGAGIWLVRDASLRHWRSVGLEAPPGDVSLAAHGALAEAARTNEPAGGDGFAVPLALAGQVVAVLHAQHAEHSRASIEILARHAARCLEALTAFKTARAMTDRGTAANDGAPAAAGAAAVAIEDVQSEDHVSAKRYARLLVSEIKLYHEEAVMDGRRDGDLAARLGGEIRRARVMYDQRVPSHVRQHADYFHDELVRTLADGDAGLVEGRTLEVKTEN